MNNGPLVWPLTHTFTRGWALRHSQTIHGQQGRVARSNPTRYPAQFSYHSPTIPEPIGAAPTGKIRRPSPHRSRTIPAPLSHYSRTNTVGPAGKIRHPNPHHFPDQSRNIPAVIRSESAGKPDDLPRTIPAPFPHHNARGRQEKNPAYFPAPFPHNDGVSGQYSATFPAGFRSAP